MSARRLASYLPVVRLPLAVSVAARLVKIAADVALPSVAVYLVARLALGEDLGVSLPGVLVGIGLVSAVARYVEQLLGHWVAFRLLARLRVDFYEAIVPLAPAALAGERTGDLVARVTDDVDRIETFYAHTIAPAVAAVLVPAATVAALAVTVSGGVGAALAPFLLVGLAAPLLGSRAGREAADAARDAAGSAGAFLLDTVAGLDDVVAFGDGDRRLARLDGLSGAAAAARARSARVAGVRAAVSELALWGGTVTVLVVGTGEGVPLPELAAAVAAAFLAFRPLDALTRVIPSLEGALAAARRVFAVTDRAQAVSEPASPVVPAGSSVRFDDVTFSYGDSPTLSSVSFDVPEGGTLGVVGASGAGKSTLVSLLLRFWDPDAGRVLIGGVDVRDIPLDDLRSRVAVVGASTYLFDDTLRENIRLGRPDASDDEIRRVLDLAALTEWVESLPAGLDTAIGSSGAGVSGGQRQRIGIARALLADPEVLVLDEATSDLDVDTEAAIAETLRPLLAGRTVIVIAHRLHLVRDLPRVIVLDHGAVVESGAPGELAAAGGVYSSLLRTLADVVDVA